MLLREEKAGMRTSIVGLDRRFVLAGAAAALLTPSLARAAPQNALATQPDAAEMLAQERAQAAQQGKRVLVSFFASWCGWCVPMNAVFEDAAVRRVLEPRYRIIHMRALERSSARRALQFGNADRIYRSFASEQNDGLPFMVILNEDGSLCANSRSPQTHENIGFPSADADVAWFATMLRTGAPSLSDADIAVVRDACARNS